MKGIIKFIAVFSLSMLIGLTLVTGLFVLVNEVVPMLDGVDYAIVMQAIAR